MIEIFLILEILPWVYSDRLDGKAQKVKLRAKV